MDKKLKILLDKVKESDPNLNTMDRNTRIRAGNYQFPFSGQQMDYLLLTLAKKLSEEELTAEQFKNGLKNAILAYKDGPIA